MPLFTKQLSRIIKKIDQELPYPLFYPFLMKRKEKLLFDKLIKASKHYLEFGLGGSTLRALAKSRSIIYTVESSMEWIEYMRKYRIVKKFENERLFIYYVNIGPTKEMGFPVSDAYKNVFEKYSSNIFHFINPQKIDLVLIDGRFRVACALKTILKCYGNENIKILIHDFWNRNQYHIVLKYLEVLDKVEKLGLFSIKRNIDLNLVKKDYETYKTDPR
ncbi:hypothetical protein [Thermodesulfatator atlanticus]|uniref:hypothetical protein n=1 Tax=Thermodesulfatator atlanticus TaxID=501497 RepID=UPI0003B5B220|nr:hypothetical protein [Thermodesulfatator atlanticus]